MDDTNDKRRREGTPERRNYAPPGRLRRIFHDHRGATLAMIFLAVAAVSLFAATSAWAVNERFKRDVTQIAYTHDAQSLQFLEQQEAKSVAEMQGRVQTAEQKAKAMEPSNRAYLVVSIAERRVLYLKGRDTLFRAPVAVGSGETMVLDGQTKRFQTPRGRMSITHKEKDPVWVPPNWHYVQIARKNHMGIIDMSDAPPNALAGYPEGQVPISHGAVIIPPWGSPQRRYKGTLGAAKLEMEDGYYFHGTDNENSVGSAASHGCLRMRKEDILWMYDHVPVGTQVYIY
ncbi:MAG TPA: L,D-transpeptidase [Longimicrobiaceae bacterium]|jgi:lipoprotein-anchoring transpeptidase ErfK/SrfK|nr:L,D-transpeptidase [Longimicrobiaceae bacterium]